MNIGNGIKESQACMLTGVGNYKVRKTHALAERLPAPTHALAVEYWEESEGMVIDRVKPFGVLPRDFNPTLTKEYYGTGNETVEQGRYAEYITRVLSRICELLDVSIYMAEVSNGQGIDKTLADRSEKPKAFAEKEKDRKDKKAAKEYSSGDGSIVPDLAMLTDDKEGIIRVVGEMKFQLTFKLHKDEAEMDHLTRKLGT